MRNIDITPVFSSKDLTQFIRLPWDIYKGNSIWVPPLISKQKENFNQRTNPFFKNAEAQSFLAKLNGKNVGRITAIVDHRHNKYHGSSVGYFGFFESINDGEVSDTLFGAANNWLGLKGIEEVWGPINLSLHDSFGLQIDSFESSPIALSNYNHPYYTDLIEDAGFITLKDLLSYYISYTTVRPEKFQRVTRKVLLNSDIKVRPINLKCLAEELGLIKDIYNDAFSENWGFVPLTTQEIDYIAGTLKSLIDPDFVLLAFVKEEPAWFSITIPDFNQLLKILNGRLLPFGFLKVILNKKKVDLFRVFLMGVCKEYRYLGIDAVFYYKTYLYGAECGYRGFELSVVQDDNYAMRNTVERMGARIYKRYRLYKKNI